MASVVSLGTHQPAGLHHAVQELLLPADVPSSSYTWDILVDESDTAGPRPSAPSSADIRSSTPTTSPNTDGGVEDELLVVEDCVIWCRGGVLRKTFRFALEKEPITLALLAYFPTSEDVPTEHLGRDKGGFGDDSKRKTLGPNGKDLGKTVLSKAIVVFLKTQAHIYFLSGTSHIVHMPFEVEAAVAAPIGVIIQRRARTEGSAPVALEFPKVPPNSFVSSQPTALGGSFSSMNLSPQSARSRHQEQVPFSTAALGNPRELPSRLVSTLGNMGDAPWETESRWPRLVCLTDPFSSLSSIVTEPDGGANVGVRSGTGKNGARGMAFLDPAEEILHVEQIHRPGAPKIRGRDALTLIVTTNRRECTFTVWRLKYLDPPDPFLARHQRTASAASAATAARRRSSMPPGLGGPASVASTPVTATFRESLGGAAATGSSLPAKRPRKSERQEPKRPPPLDIAATLEGDKEVGVHRRTSRRISSMLARADLSASQQERGIFDQAFANATSFSGKRGESLGRTSAGAGGFGPVVLASLNSFLLEAPIDSVLDELRTTGDFESFTHMGLEDHGRTDGRQNEMLLTRIQTITAETTNLRYSTMENPARTQAKVFILPSPQFAMDEHGRGQVVVGIQDCLEKRLILLTLSSLVHPVPDVSSRKPPRNGGMPGGEGGAISVSAGNVVRAQNVIDSAKIMDGDLSMILILSESESNPPLSVLSIQAPWSHYTTLPLQLRVAQNTRALCHFDPPGPSIDSQERPPAATGEMVDFAQQMIAGVGNPMRRGVVDIILSSGALHQLRIQLNPTCRLTKGVLDACRSVLPASVSEGLLAGWWQVSQWLETKKPAGHVRHIHDKEWSPTVVLFLSMFLNLGKRRDVRGPRNSPRKARQPPSRSATRSAATRSASALDGADDGRSMDLVEASNPPACAPWMANKGWEWTLEEEDDDESATGHSQNAQHATAAPRSFISRHIQLARDFLTCPQGDHVLGQGGQLPTASSRPVETRRKLASDMFVAMHLLLEEQALDIMMAESLSPGRADLRMLLARLARWLGWTEWAAEYELGMQEDLDPKDDSEVTISPAILPPFAKPSILAWIHSNLISHRPTFYPGLSDIYYDGLTVPEQLRRKNRRWDAITPRSLVFRRFFEALAPNSTAVQFVEAMFEAGITKAVLESLPESLLVPLQDALFMCQPLPPASWPQELLGLVDRSDISLILSPLSRSSRLQFAANILTPTHNATWDFRSLCQTVDDRNRVGYEENSEGTDKQAIVRTMFSQDRRLNEAQDLLSTSKTRVVRLDQESGWTDNFYLEKQKELVARVATGTLAIPAGRAMLNYGLRYPLLTQKLHISNFNLNCVVRPNNVTVGADKTLITEDKICWGFFHQGVATALAISPDARGIDTSWILYNKPGQDLSNRHAGFLLGLGLNGHLKHVAKWVAFKYLTPKHTMTSVGLLLGLAASYMGTMDSLMTRLLSVHATRMLPRGAADLNISPQMQTSGIMGIGLLYANSQHRRMSEIMMSEIEHVDDEDEEEPLRSECYRLAAGFALGFINMAKGNDLGGLHDMRLTEKLVSLGTATKKVEIVHVLDRAAAGSVIALALIFMKSEDRLVARKVDAPDAAVQFDYIRPDVLLLRTMTKHLILWSEMRPSFDFIEASMPQSLGPRHKLTSVSKLNSSDLPLFSIIAGTSFALALRFAGSARPEVRDLLVHYLDQFMRITRLRRDSKCNYDEELTRNNARMCQDVLALSCAIVMAGTGDIVVLRRLRALHGRDDAKTTYGSHLAAHLAIGALFVGSGLMTFGNSDMAVASLLLAFYPVFPSGVMDNRSHLQAFRHFWVLATEKRCLVTKDVVTGQPVSVPILVKTADDALLRLNTPCLLPPLPTISSLQTDASPGYWDTCLDMSYLRVDTRVLPGRNGGSLSSGSAPPSGLPTLYLRRRPFPKSIILPPGRQRDPTEWIFSLPALRTLSASERAEVVDTATVARGSSVDARLELESVLGGGNRDALVGLKGLLEWAEQREKRFAVGASGQSADRDSKDDGGDEGDQGGEWWIRSAVLDEIKGRIWLASGDGAL